MRNLGPSILHVCLYITAPFALWQGFVWVAAPKPYVFASPAHAWAALTGPRGVLVWQALWESLAVLAVALPIAIIAGMALALLMSLFRTALSLVLPTLIGLFALPIYGLNRAFFSVLEVGFSTRAAVAALILYFPILIAGLVGLRTIDPAVLEAAKLDGAGRLRILISIMIPLAGPALAGGLMAAGAVAPLALMAAEQSGLPGGLGQLILSQLNRDIDLSFAAMGLLILIGLTLFALADGARRLLSTHTPDSFQLLRT